MEPLDHDATYKAIYGHRFMVEELARWLIPAQPGGRELVDALDFGTLARVQEQSVAGGRRRSNDIVWRVRFRDGDDADPDAWMHLVLMLEFQSEVDFLMALRCRHYVDGFHLENWRGRRFKATDRLPPVLAFVIYNGASRWSAARRVIDLVTPGATSDEPPHGLSRASPVFAGDGYVLLDSGRVGADDLKRDNAAALLAGIEHPTPETVAELVVLLRRRVAGRDLSSLRELLLGWVQRVVERRLGMNLEMDDMAEVDQLDETDDDAYFAARRKVWEDQYRAEGREQAREQARAEAREQAREQARAEARASECACLHRLAARRFGSVAANSLAAFLESVDDAKRLAEVGDWIVDCATAAELIERVEAAGQGN